MEIIFDPDTRELNGSSKISYSNNSPDTLSEIVIHTFPNIFKSGSARDRDIYDSDVSKGLILEELKIGNELVINNVKNQNGKQIYSEATFTVIPLKIPMLPNSKTELVVVWNYTLNKETHLRTGQTSDTGFMIAYFFPRIAVYDDIDGWNKYAYTGNTEFYNDFGDFEVEISVPENYLVWATGQLTNPSEVLKDKFYERFKAAQKSEQKIAIVDFSDIGKDITLSKTDNTWKYSAKKVPDFAFATAKNYIWGARSVDVNRESDRLLTIHTAYDPKSKDFKKVNEFTKESIEYMTSVFPKVDFPFENHTVFNGLGMMEYPMMANDRSFEDLHRSRWLTHHETFHSYFPFLTGLNETKYAWLDEGLAMYGTNEFLRSINSPLKDEIGFQNFDGRIGYDSDFPIFAVSKYLKNPTYYNNSYPKATAFFLVIREYLGQEEFTSFIQKFVSVWKGKHPTALDFLFLLNESTPEDLTWLIKPWIFEFGYVDLSIGNVTSTEEGYKINIENKGNYPVPVYLDVTYKDGTTANILRPVRVWQNGEKNFLISLGTNKEIQKLVLRDISLIDANPGNNIFTFKTRSP
ncbi:M1 family metallopeptidase [Christiangramia sp.]|uniref:M1 family metallopeptidase n=1 Tax=Christiangramia sp. TaxID=1931228 RepID=UPI0026064C46|nr:M1 family metallopeptidase [Christiangramia sp.]